MPKLLLTHRFWQIRKLLEPNVLPTRLNDHKAPEESWQETPITLKAVAPFAGSGRHFFETDVSLRFVKEGTYVQSFVLLRFAGFGIVHSGPGRTRAGALLGSAQARLP
jgi:hypothetical protein